MPITLQDQLFEITVQFLPLVRRRSEFTMKIQDEKNIKQVLKPETHHRTGSTTDNFKKILSDMQSKAGGLQDKQPLLIDTLEKPNPSLQSASALNRLHAENFNAPPISQEHNVKKVEQLLDLLESYSEALSDPKKNLRDLSPLIKLLEKEQHKLEELEKHLDDGDMLQEILKQAVILSQVEVSRYNRGDYL